MKQFARALVVVLTAVVALFTTGCHTVSPATVVDSTRLRASKQIYVVVSTNKDRGFRKEIERNLTARGFTVSSGSMDRMSAAEELYLIYDDRWKWDMVMYPGKVNIAIYDAKTKEQLGSAEFRNSMFHTYPDPPEITDELLGRIFGEPEGNFMK
jgi:hypothetical protein